MADFWFYTRLGFFHVLDPGGYDHVLFLMALALPFSFLQWKKVFWLATLFTVTHCISLALAAFGLVEIDAGELAMLLEGIDAPVIKRRKRYRMTPAELAHATAR